VHFSKIDEQEGQKQSTENNWVESLESKGDENEDSEEEEKNAASNEEEKVRTEKVFNSNEV
jgi:hypothetical protein